MLFRLIVRSPVLLFILLFSLNSVAAELIFTAPPRETPQAGMKIYQPVARYLTELLGVPVVYEHPGNWLRYQREMREDHYDIVLDGPHFVSWRIEHLGHEPVIKLPGTLQFMLLVDKSRKELDDPDKLIGKKICGISPPHLSTLAILDYYRNPVRQPVIKGIRGGMGKVAKTIFSKKLGCDAVILRTIFFKKKLSKEKQKKLKVLFLSQSMPNQAISVSRRVNAVMKEKMRFGLTHGKGLQVTSAILRRFAGKAKSFIAVKPGEYNGYNMLLEGVIFGW